MPRDATADVAIIGGGLTGVLTAYMLKSNGVDAIVLEANRIGSGMTGHTTAKVTSQHNLIYHRLIKEFGDEKAAQYAKANEWAIDCYRRLIDKKGIQCDWQEQPAYLYTLEDEHVAILKEEAQAAASLGIAATYLEGPDHVPLTNGLPFPIRAALRFDHQAMFHPLKFLHAIAEEVQIYEQTRVLNIDYEEETGHPEPKSLLTTSRGTVEAKHVVFACHFPFVNVPGYYFARMHQERSYLVAYRGAGDVGGMYKGIDQKGYSFRNHGEYLLVGGAGHRTGENQDGGCYAGLRKATQKWYPDAQEAYAWSAQDCISLDAVPYIGRYAERRPTWYVGTGYRKWGMTHSMVSAGILSAIIAKRPLQPGISSFFDLNQEELSIYHPHRFRMPVSGEYFRKDVKTIGKALLRELLKMPDEKLDEVELGHGGTVDFLGEKVGVYRSPEGQTFLVSTRCPHLGCELAWNPEELTWDCPCHGSRFDYRGNLVSGPATTDLDKPDQEEPGLAEPE